MTITRLLAVTMLLFGIASGGALAADRGDLLEQRLDRKGERAAQRLDHRGDRIERRHDRFADRAASHGRHGLASGPSFRGERMDAVLDRKGFRAERRWDRRGDRLERRWERRH